MDSQNQQTNQITLPALTADAAMREIDKASNAEGTITHTENVRPENVRLNSMPLSSEKIHCPPIVEDATADQILQYLQSGKLWMVNSRRRNGLILCKSFYAEFAGPGAAVGGLFDLDCQRVIPVGDLSLIQPNCHEERQKAYLIRRQWIRLTQQFTDQSVPLQRATMILNQFENYFDQETIARIPDEAFAQLVGVLPYSVRMARRKPGKLNVKVKA
jgi:hypothetical protein